jgi:hypothetical protein
MACRFLKAGVSGGAERAQLVAEIEAKQGVGAPCVCMLANSLLIRARCIVCANKLTREVPR